MGVVTCISTFTTIGNLDGKSLRGKEGSLCSMILVYRFGARWTQPYT